MKSHFYVQFFPVSYIIYTSCLGRLLLYLFNKSTFLCFSYWVRSITIFYRCLCCFICILFVYNKKYNRNYILKIRTLSVQSMSQILLWMLWPLMRQSCGDFCLNKQQLFLSIQLCFGVPTCHPGISGCQTLRELGRQRYSFGSPF